MDKRSFIATLSVCGTVIVSSVLLSHAGAPQSIPPIEEPIESHGAPPCPCPGDANCDGIVNFADITTVLANWQRVCCPAGMSCDDGDPCTIGDTCIAGQGCVGFPINCDDFDPCTDDFCCQGVCIHTPIPGCGPCTNDFFCDDLDPCTIDICEPMSMICVHTPIPGCGDCKIDRDCDDGLPCTLDLCANGVCTHASFPDGTPCNDGNRCTVGDVCINGTCTPGAILNCNDNNPCTDDTCDAMTGLCSHTPIMGCCATAADCEDGNPCTFDVCMGSSCVHTPYTCDDGNPCTIDSCNGSGGCTYTIAPINTPCDDGNPCTINDRCNGAGVCFGTPIVCNDNNACTNDFCVGGVCVFTPAANGTPCNDGNLCTTGDACNAGVCTPTGSVMCPPGSFCNPATGGCEIPTP